MVLLNLSVTGKASVRLRRLVGWRERKGREECERAWKVGAEDIKARGYNLDIKEPHTKGEDYGDPETLGGTDEHRVQGDRAARPVEERTGGGAVKITWMFAVGY